MALGVVDNFNSRTVSSEKQPLGEATFSLTGISPARLMDSGDTNGVVLSCVCPLPKSHTHLTPAFAGVVKVMGSSLQPLVVKSNAAVGLSINNLMESKALPQPVPEVDTVYLPVSARRKGLIANSLPVLLKPLGPVQVNVVASLFTALIFRLPLLQTILLPLKSDSGSAGSVS